MMAAMEREAAVAPSATTCRSPLTLSPQGEEGLPP